DAGSIDPQRRKSLDVGLYAGPSPAVGAGNSQCDGGAHDPTSPSALSTAARIALAAAAISPAANMAEMTATPDAPARTIWPARSASIPAMAPTGRSCRAE